jgi:hypothetical protein
VEMLIGEESKDQEQSFFDAQQSGGASEHEVLWVVQTKSIRAMEPFVPVGDFAALSNAPAR